MIVDEYAAVEARLEADTALVVRDTVYDSAGELFRGTYVVLFGGAPDILDDNRLAKAQDPDSAAVYMYTVRCVSTTPAGVRSALKHVTTQLVGFIPTITNRTCDPIRMTHTTDVEPDTSVKPPLFYSDAEFTLASQRP
jgi:hypothetical protein